MKLAREGIPVGEARWLFGPAPLNRPSIPVGEARWLFGLDPKQWHSGALGKDLCLIESKILTCPFYPRVRMGPLDFLDSEWGMLV